MSIGQISRGDAGDARKKLKRLVAETVLLIHASVSNPLSGPLLLKVVAVKAYEMDTHALLNKGALPNRISWYFCKKMALFSTSTDRQVTIAAGKVSQVVVPTEEFPISCGSLVVPLKFSVVRNAQFDAIIGSPTLDSLQVNLDFGREQVTLAVGNKKVFFPLLREPLMIDGPRNDSEYLTSPKEL